MKNENTNDFSELSDHELVDAFGCTGDPWAFEALKAEQRRRTADKALAQATLSNKIATGSLVVAILSFIVAIIALFKVG